MTKTAKTANQAKPAPKRDAAIAWIIEHLKNGPQPVLETREKAQADGHRLSTLRNATLLAPVTVINIDGVPSYQLSGETKSPPPVKPRKNIGLPRIKYSPEVAKSVCLAVAEGKSLNTICKEDGMPALSTVMNWIGEYSEFMEQYLRAKQIQAEQGYERIMEIENSVVSKELDPNAARVLIDSIKWRLGKLKPNKYGDRIQVQQDGNLTVTVQAFTNKGARDLKRVGP